MGFIFNPLILISFQSALAILLTNNGAVSEVNYLFYVLCPLLLYLIYYIVMNKVFPAARSNASTNKFSNAQVCASYIIILLIVISDLWIIVRIIPFYGGLYEAIHKFGSTDVVTYLQRQGPLSIRQLIIINFFLPVFIIPLIMSGYKLTKYLFIFFCLIVVLMAGGLYGARTLFLEPLIVSVIIYCLGIRKSSRAIMLMVSGLAVLIAGMSFLQASRFNARGIDEGSRILLNYYSISLNQGAKVVVNDETRQPLYWTLSSTFNLPIISKLIGTKTVYEGIFGKIPINTREDDFNYVKELGGDPAYNTLGIYAYTYLDAGIWGVFILLLTFIYSDFLYRLYMRGSVMGILLFPTIYVLLLDQLRTAGLFSARAPYFLLSALCLYFLGKLTKRGRYGYLGKGADD
ncbi:hypothetical protein Dcar01_02825 [Deinococcus carri]|uniref:Oligosaccharide repeat unit polymerase n=1 Tax=Deinococcus carri TaxID=1211323 RepID=A0ABP9W9Q8_9DEIO